MKDGYGPPSSHDLGNIEDNIGRSIADIYDVGNNYNHIYGSSPSKKPNFDYKSNLNPEAKNFTPLSKSTTVKYVPFSAYKTEIKTPPESSYLSSPHLVRKIMRSNTINFNNPLENAVVPQPNAAELQAVTTRDSNNNNKPDTYLKNYQEDILRQFDPYFNAATAVTNKTSSIGAMSTTNENATHDSSSSAKTRQASSTDLFLDCDEELEEIESDVLDDADLDADDEDDEGAAGVNSSTAESVSEYLQSCGYPFKKSKKYSHQFSQSISNDGSKVVVSEKSDDIPAAAVAKVDEVLFLVNLLRDSVVDLLVIRACSY